MSATDTTKPLVKLDRKRAHQTYRLADGTKVPGVTTVLKLLDKPALLAWAWKLGTEGVDFRKAAEWQADAGTVCHFMIECFLKGQEPDLSDYGAGMIDQAENGYLKFLDWWQQGGFSVVATEAQLVHEAARYGGTLDIVARSRDGNLRLIDIKTSKDIYEEMLFQVAAYQELWNANTWTTDPITLPPIICRVGKDLLDFEARELTTEEYDVATAVWGSVLACYHAREAFRKTQKGAK